MVPHVASAALDESRPASEHAVEVILGSLAPYGYRTVGPDEREAGAIGRLLVGPTGVFLLHTRQCGDHDSLHADCLEHAIGELTRRAMTVRRRLERSGIEAWVEAVLLCPVGLAIRGPTRLSHAVVAHAGDLRALLRHRPSYLNAQEMDRAMRAIGSDH